LSEFLIGQEAGKSTHPDAPILKRVEKKNKLAGHREFRHQDDIATRVGSIQSSLSQNFHPDQSSHRVVERHLLQKARESDTRLLLRDRKIAVEGLHGPRQFIHQTGRAVA